MNQVDYKTVQHGGKTFKFNRKMNQVDYKTVQHGGNNSTCNL